MFYARAKIYEYALRIYTHRLTEFGKEKKKERIKSNEKNVDMHFLILAPIENTPFFIFIDLIARNISDVHRWNDLRSFLLDPL